MVEEKYSRKYKKWKSGDTFALKLTRNELYKNRYLIFIKYDNLDWEETSNVSFRVKITKGGNLPSSFDELDELEYVIVRLCPYENRFLPFSGLKTIDEILKVREKIEYYPDEYGNLNIYIFDIYFGKNSIKILDNMIYLGNFNFTNPEKEYIPFSRHNAGYYLLSDLEEKIISDYESYNLKKSPIYDKKNLRTFEELGTFVPPTSEEIARIIKENDWDFSNEIKKEDSLTYVGGEDEDPFEK